MRGNYVLTTMNKVLFIICFVPLFATAQSKEVTDSLALATISFNKDSAVYDIQNGSIRIIHLLSAWGSEDSFVEQEDLEFVEEKYGFKYHYVLIDFPDTDLKKQEEAYNSVVYHHLDSLCLCNSKKSIYSDVKKRFQKRVFNNNKH